MSKSRVDAFAALVADVYELAGVLRRHGDEIAGRVGQTQARWQLLSVVSEGEWTVPRIAQRLGISRQAVQRVADDLERDGLLRFAGNPEHRRSPLVEPTDTGRSTLFDISIAARSWQRHVTEALDNEAIGRATHDIRELLDRIAAVDAAGPTRSPRPE